MRWERHPAGTQAVYIGEAGEFPGLEPAAVLDEKGYPFSKRTYYLFGLRRDPNLFKKLGVPEEQQPYAYAELRIPRLLYYPVDWEKQRPKAEEQTGEQAKPRAERVQLLVREYTNVDDGRLAFYRFVRPDIAVPADKEQNEKGAAS